MREKFLAWCRECGIDVGDDWTVEQLCDAVVTAKAQWPPDLTNEQGWQLWTAVLRREFNVQSVQWIEEDNTSAFNVLFRLADKRQFSVEVTRQKIVEADFGSICKSLEVELAAWKRKDDADREEQLRLEDATYLAKIPDCMDYVIGFRAWNVSGQRLMPIGMGNDVWEGGLEVRATCGQGAIHRAPDHNCECGLYAWNSWKAVSANRNEQQVFGAVRAWGRMEIHNAGFRAEWMQPVLLGYDDIEDRVEGLGQLATDTSPVPDQMTKTRLVRGPDYDRVVAIAQRLGGIPVVGYSQMEAMAAEHGLIVGANPHLLPDPTDG